MKETLKNVTKYAPLVLTLCFAAGVSLAIAQEPATSEGSAPDAAPLVFTPPPYCKPCLYYGGDTEFNRGLSYPNGNTLPFPGSAAYAVFGIPKGETWAITGLFTNDLCNDPTVLDPMQATWSISSGVSAGNPGTVIASGTAAARVQPTGRSTEGLIENTIGVEIPLLRLGAGLYWLTVVPQCTNAGDNACTTAEFALDDTFGLNAYGPPQPQNFGFDTSPFFGLYYTPLCQFQGRTTECRLLSAGVLGRK